MSYLGRCSFLRISSNCSRVFFAISETLTSSIKIEDKAKMKIIAAIMVSPIDTDVFTSMIFSFFSNTNNSCFGMSRKIKNELC